MVNILMMSPTKMPHWQEYRRKPYSKGFSCSRATLALEHGSPFFMCVEKHDLPENVYAVIERMGQNLAGKGYHVSIYYSLPIDLKVSLRYNLNRTILFRTIRRMI